MRSHIVIGALVLCAAMGCQTYDFEPVEPLAISQTTQTKNVVGRQFKPNMMILLDKSGSMNFAANPMNPNCPARCNETATPCPANCPTRIQELRAAMNTFLSTSGDVARMGLTIYPSNSQCGAAAASEVLVPVNTSDDIASDLQMTASQINARVQMQTVTGGTPTAGSLLFVGGLPSLNDPLRQDFVLLLTDGLPNCNENNTNACTNPTACRCTVTSCGTSLADTFCKRGCLDKDGSIAAVVNLKQRDIRTIVVGFGADFGTSGDGPEVLNAMAEAGGFAKACPMLTDAECGGAVGSCDKSVGVCVQKFYQASSATDLARTLADISASIGADSICKYALDAAPSDPRFISVLVNGVTTLGGIDTWEYAAGAIELKGTLCDRVKAATPIDPVKLEFRIVEAIK
jgi:hypothetical protein